MILPITLTIAGAAAILHIWLSLRVSRLRRPLKIGFGDGGNETLLRRMRAHGNFAENMPIFLILLALLELAGGERTILWAAAIAFILARLLHAFGMDRPGANWMRVSGISLSWLVLLGLAGWALSFAYRDAAPASAPGVQISPGRKA
ncbi:MAG TPA: MAPEG family protein [Allosphingosinicella sp.]|nr:MAPEG family protein [Allosphingosinicella sp.]